MRRSCGDNEQKVTATKEGVHTMFSCHSSTTDTQPYYPRGGACSGSPQIKNSFMLSVHNALLKERS